MVESTKLKAVEDVPLLPLAGQLFEGMEFPTGEVAKKARNAPLRSPCNTAVAQLVTDHGGGGCLTVSELAKRNMSIWARFESGFCIWGMLSSLTTHTILRAAIFETSCSGMGAPISLPWMSLLAYDDGDDGAFVFLLLSQLMGNVPTTKQTVVYIDDSLRVMEDKAGELYIYTR